MDASRPHPRLAPALKGLERLTVILFLAAIVSPMVDLWVRPDIVRSTVWHEDHEPAPKPALPRTMPEINVYPGKYEAYFKDSFGLRDQLLLWNSRVKAQVFGVSPSPIVYFGREGWLFYRGDDAQQNRLGRIPFSPRMLEVWAIMLENKRALLASVGVKYLFVVAPDKESIYPEFLPAAMKPRGPTRLEQWLAHMHERAPAVEILDLRGALCAAKKDDRPGEHVYGELGTHWSGRGALVALRALLERLSPMVPGLHPEETDSFVRVEASDQGDSLSPGMFLEDVMVQHTHLFVPAHPRARIKTEDRLGGGRLMHSTLDDPSRPRLMLRHDSFGPLLSDGLAEQCSVLECMWSTYLDMGEVVTVEPDVLIDMYVERMFNNFDPAALVPDEARLWSGRFEHSQKVLVAMDRSKPDWGLEKIGETSIGPPAPWPRPHLPVVMNNESDMLGVGVLTPIEGELPLLHLVVDSPFETQLFLAYRPPGMEHFVQRNSYSLKLHPGRNDLYLPLERPEARGELRLRLGSQPGTYQLLEFELRSVRIY